MNFVDLQELVEKRAELVNLLKDLRKADCRIRLLADWYSESYKDFPINIEKN